MVLKIVWRKVRLYKRFELDIWGFRLLGESKDSKLSKLFNAWNYEREQARRSRRSRYIYRIDLDQPARVFKRFKWTFAIRKLSRLFYLTLGYAQFRKLARVASKREGNWVSNFIMLVENRILGMLYRMQIIMNVFELRSFVLNGKALVNNKKLTYCNAAVGYAEVLRFQPRLAAFLRYDIIKRFARGSIYFNVPRYMFVSYKLMFAFVYKEPLKRDLAFPIKAIDVYRGADFY